MPWGESHGCDGESFARHCKSIFRQKEFFLFVRLLLTAHSSSCKIFPLTLPLSSLHGISSHVIRVASDLQVFRCLEAGNGPQLHNRPMAVTPMSQSLLYCVASEDVPPQTR